MRKRRLKSEMNVVPYIDVMLVLLVIFMVAAPLINTGTVDLPKVAHSNPLQPDKHPLTITVGENNALSIKGIAGEPERKLTNLQELRKVVQAARMANPDLPVVIAGDKEAVYKHIMGVMDELKSAQVKQVGLLVNTK